MVGKYGVIFLRLSILFISFLLCLSFFVDEKEAKENKTVYYISSSFGNDNNEGSENKPLKSLSNEYLPRNNVTIRLKRGDVFYESLSDLKKCKIEAYGKGSKPILCGMKTIKKDSVMSVWKFVGGGVWRIDMSRNECFYGYAKNGIQVNNIGVIYNEKYNLIYGHLVQKYSQLKNIGDFYTTSDFIPKNITSETFKYLYLKSDKNPGELGPLSFSCKSSGVFNIDNCVISDLKIFGFSDHGMCRLNNSVIKNCEIDLVGGSIQTGTPVWVRYGNGIEFYMNKDLKNCEVKNCIISRTYDCGATIQLSRYSQKGYNPISIKFTDNHFINCRQAFEHFIKKDMSYIDCEFSYNYIYNCGDNGFNSPEKRDAAILSYESVDRLDLKISNNQFWGSSFYCGNHLSKKTENNIIYIYDDQYILNCSYSCDDRSIFAKDGAKSIFEYEKRIGDSTNVFFIMERNTKRTKKYKKYFLKKMSRHENSFSK